MEEDEEEELELPAQQKSFYDWTLAARDPDYYDYDMEEEEEDDDDIAQSTPCKKRIGGGGMMLFTPPPPQKTKTKSVSASFPTPPNTSPAPAPVPAPMNVDMGVDMGVQVSFPDPEKEKLKHVKEGLTVQNGELARHLGILRAEVTRHEEVWGRMVGKLKLPLPNPAASNNNNNNSAEAIIIIEGKIHEILTGLDDLGFPDIQSLANYVRQARLELERMAPGEITYGLYESPHGKEILDMVLERLRKAREDAETIDMYHAQEFSLRQQLGDRIAVCQLRDKEIAELKVGVERHVIAAGSYQRDIAELEELVRRLEEEGQGRDEEVVRARVKIDELQDEIVKLRDEIAKLQLTRKAETKVRNESQRSLITVWEKRVGELRRRIYGLEEELKGAGETVLKLRLENAELVEEKMKMKKTGGMRTRSMSVSADGSSSSSYLSGDLARRKRRRPDSGLGLMDGDEDDVEFVS
ncbi:hypothetical protein GGS20DRAFT_531325 [Poronia punctata]|nr:hypothetical protein GGS20DRAFT_531325 [Poronia punctata]